MTKTKTAVITGASRGIGAATAELFASSGYHVLINYNRSEKEALNLYNKLIEKGLSVGVFKADVTKRKEVEHMMKYCIQEFGGIDVLINNEGISQQKLFTEITEMDFDEMITGNLKGAFHCSQEALKYMLPRKMGKIINISSIWGHGWSFLRSSLFSGQGRADRYDKSACQRIRTIQYSSELYCTGSGPNGHAFYIERNRIGQLKTGYTTDDN